MKHKSRDASPLRRFWKRKLLPLLFWLAVWQGTVWLLMAVKKMPTTALVLPSPLLVAETLAELVGTAVFWQTALASLGRIFSGLLVGVLLGTAAAVCTSAWEWADCILSPAVRVIRATPVASFILLVILWFPTGQVPVVVSALMVLPVVWGNVKRGVAQTDPLLLEAARVYRFGRWKTVRLVYIPSVLPYFASGCHTALGLAWKAGVAAEVLCVPRLAIGTQVYFSKIYLETPALFAWTLVVLTLSFLLEQGLGALLGRLEKGVKL